MEAEQKPHTWKNTLTQAGAFVAVIVIVFAAAVPLANRSVRLSKGQ